MTGAINTVRQERDLVISTLRAELELRASHSRFPLDNAVQKIQSRALSALVGDSERAFSDLLNLFEATAVSAAVAIKRFASTANDTSGIRDALVDLWSRAEAARSVLFDTLEVWVGAERKEREEDLWETARLLAPDAIAIAMRLSEPVSQYVEFASKVIGQDQASKVDIPRA